MITWVTTSCYGRVQNKKVWKVLWTQKVPACLLTLLYAYGQPCLPPVHHHYAPPRIVLQQAAVLRQQYTSAFSVKF